MLKTVLRGVLLFCIATALVACSEDLGLDQNGQPVNAKKYWLIINYWAEWCAPCQREIPELNALSLKLQNEDVRVVGVNFDGLSGDELLQASRRMMIGYSVLSRDPASMFHLPPNPALPATYIVTPDRRKHVRLMGEQSAESLLTQLKLLQSER